MRSTTAPKASTLAATPDIDLNGDGIDDLLIGAADADTETTTNGLTKNAGRVYVVYGAPTVYPLPSPGAAQQLTNDPTGHGMSVSTQNAC